LSVTYTDPSSASRHFPLKFSRAIVFIFIGIL
jgi:hypothetical protein